METSRQYKYISIRLFKEIEFLLTDAISIQYNTNADILNIYDILTFNGQRVISNKICENFLNKKRQYKSDDIKNKIMQVIRDDPTISAKKLKEITGYNWHMVCRYYMSIRRELKYKNN